MPLHSKTPAETITSAVASEDITLEGSGQYTALLVQAVFGTYDGSFTIEGAVHESGATKITMGYENRLTGAIASAAITADAIIVIPTSGLDVQIATAGRTTGTLTLYVIPILAR
jgi:hypothetical protein